REFWKSITSDSWLHTLSNWKLGRRGGAGGASGSAPTRPKSKLLNGHLLTYPIRLESTDKELVERFTRKQDLLNAWKRSAPTFSPCSVLSSPFSDCTSSNICRRPQSHLRPRQAPQKPLNRPHGPMVISNGPRSLDSSFPFPMVLNGSAERPAPATRLSKV
ncbi:hypothetical protein PTTG_28902, partial [Puccinia triticina 1-1 BBBD Race 1]